MRQSIVEELSYVTETEQEPQRSAKLAPKLRELGVDPDRI